MYNAVREWRDVVTEVVKYYEGSVFVENCATSTTCKLLAVVIIFKILKYLILLVLSLSYKCKNIVQYSTIRDDE